MTNHDKICSWCTSDPIYIDYHNTVWGRPQFDSRDLFAKLCLDGQQAGLSWITILKKQENYYRLFYQFEPEKIVRYAPRRMAKLLQDPGIIRNRLKVESIIKNARAFIQLESSGQSFSDYLWQFVDGEPIQNQFRTLTEVPASSIQSEQMSKALKKLGFTFVGPTICYAFMQAVGMVNDHLVSCPAHAECRDLALLAK